MDITMLAILKKLAGGGGASAAVEIDNKTIVKGSDGKLKTSVGGYVETKEITWDGETQGLTNVQNILFRVSDIVFTKNAFENAVLSYLYGGETAQIAIDKSLLEEKDGCLILPNMLCIVVTKSGASINGLTFPQTGIYFYNDGSSIYTKQLMVSYAEPIPKKYYDFDVDKIETTANLAQSTAEALEKTTTGLVSFVFDKQTSGRDTFVFNGFPYYKISDFNPDPADVVSYSGTDPDGNPQNEITVGTNCVEYGQFIVVNSPGSCSLEAGSNTFSFTAPSSGLYAVYSQNTSNVNFTAGTANFEMKNKTGIVLYSSTINSKKKFKISVDDSGTLSVTEVT